MALTTIKTGGLADNSVTDAKVADAITVTGAQTGITQVGTLTAGTWNGTAIASAYLDADTAHLSGSTFTGSVQISHGTTPDFTLNDTGGTTNKRVFRISGGGDAVYFEGRNNDNSGAGAVGGDGSIMSMSLTDASTTFAGDIILDKTSDPSIILKRPNASAQINKLLTDSAGLYVQSYGHATGGNNQIIFMTEESDSSSSPTERMRIESDGKIGINDSSPAERFTVNGDTRLDGKIGIGKSPQSGYEFDLEASSGNANMRLKATGANQGVRVDLDHHSGDKAEVHFYNGGHSSTAIVSNEITNGLIFKVGGTSGASKVDAVKIESDGDMITRRIMPVDDGTHDLGDNTKSWRKVYTDGILFNGDTSNDNMLDDYEEGTYTWKIYTSNGNSSNAEWQSRSGYTLAQYTKIGNMVTVSGRWEVNAQANASTSSDYYVFMTLPLAVAGHGGSQPYSSVGAGTFNRAATGDTDAELKSAKPIVFQGDQYMFWQMASGTSSGESYIMGFSDSNFEGHFCITYRAA